MKKNMDLGLVAILGMGSLCWIMTGLGAEPSATVRDAGPFNTAITRPSQDVTISFVRPGRITEILVKDGETVTAGQLVAKQDDSVDKATLAADKADAEDDTEEQADRAERERDQWDVTKLNGVNSSQAERKDAELKVVIDDARIKLAKAKQTKAQLKYEGTQAEVDRLQLKSPIDGVVAQSILKVGENADGSNMKVMRIVQVDPLWVEVPVKVAEARKLQKDDSVQVKFLSDNKARVGKVALVFPVGDPASQTINVRVEVPNPTKLQPGENVEVRFNQNGGVAVGRP